MAKGVGAALLFVLMMSALGFARKEETLQELMARADAASAAQRPDLCMSVAERALKEGIDAYKLAKYDEFRTDLKHAVEYSDKAHSAAIQSNKHLKSTEIKLRRVSARLKDLKLNVDFEDQAAVQSAVDQLEDFRSELLKSMFGSKRND